MRGEERSRNRRLAEWREREREGEEQREGEEERSRGDRSRGEPRRERSSRSQRGAGAGENRETLIVSSLRLTFNKGECGPAADYRGAGGRWGERLEQQRRAETYRVIKHAAHPPLRDQL